MTELSTIICPYMELEEQQLVIKWRSLNELKDKLRAVLVDLESSLGAKSSQHYQSLQSYAEKIPEEVRKLGLSTFSAAMLSVLRETHVGKQNAIDARGLAREMKLRYPLLLSKKDFGAIAHGTIFPGQKMAESGLIRMERIRDSQNPSQQSRLYWSEGTI